MAGRIPLRYKVEPLSRKLELGDFRHHIPIRFFLHDSSSKRLELGEFRHHVYMFYLHDARKQIYLAFCSGSIISETKVLSSTHCFYTNRKNPKRNLNFVQVVAGVLDTATQYKSDQTRQQWKDVDHIYTQQYYKYPSFNLAIVKIKGSWSFNSVVNLIPYSIIEQDYDGICTTVGIRTNTAWESVKTTFVENVMLIKRRTCEVMLQRTAMQYLCTQYAKNTYVNPKETEGAGLICRGTGDPSEDEDYGILVGVTSQVNSLLPTLHTHVGRFHQWLTDVATRPLPSNCFLCFILYFVLHFL